MNNLDCIKIIEMARAQVEWDYPMDYAAAFDKAIEALKQEPINDTISKLLDETFDDFCECPGGEGYFYIDGETYNTDAGYALEGMEIFIKVLKKRLAKSEG